MKKDRTSTDFIVVAFSIMLSLFFITGCSKEKKVEVDPLGLVKNGTLLIDNTVTVGNALENYKHFKSTSWNSTEDDQKRRIILFEGLYVFEKFIGVNFNEIEIKKEMIDKANEKLPGIDIRYVIEFAISLDNTSFQVRRSYYKITGKNRQTGIIATKEIQDQNLETLQTIYKNTPDPMVVGLILSASRD